MHHRALSAVASLALILSASAARADTPRRVSWWVAATPWTCVAEEDPLARAVQLACDAAGACQIAPKPELADRHAILVCGDTGWSVEAQDAKGARLWSLELGSGDADERLRRAGVWIARSESSAVLEGPPATATEESPPPDKAPKPRGAGAATDREAHVSFAAMAHGSTLTDRSYGFGPTAGGRVVAMLHLPAWTGPVRMGVALAGEQTVSGVGYGLLRGGIVAGLGAPFDNHIVGISVEGGVADLLLDASPTVGTTSLTAVVRPYGQVSAYAQIPLQGAWRPFVSLNIAAVTDAASYVIPNGFIGLDIGLALGHP